MRLDIHLQREIARKHFYDPTSSHRAIASIVGVSPSTVSNFRAILLRGNPDWDWPTLQGLDDETWRATLGTQDHSIAAVKPAPDWLWVHQERQRADATLEQIWREWRQGEPEGIGYTHFTNSYRAWSKQQRLVMRQVHRPGDKLFVDFAGRVVTVHTGPGDAVVRAQIFVAALGYSNLTFLYAVPSQTTADWAQCHVACFEYMGGAPDWVVSDNLKAAVWRRERDRVFINPTYRDCLDHYDTAPAPARSRRPKDKAKAEVSVQIAQRWVLFALRDRVFTSFEELNGVLRAHTDQLNDHPFKKLAGTRRQRFEEAERHTLKPLPAAPFELCEWQYEVRVGPDYHVEWDRRHYSVPFQLAGQRVDLRLTAKTLEVFKSNRRVALHPRLDQPGDCSTVMEHRPVSHERVLEGEPRQLLQWAYSVGEKTRQLIEHHLTDRRDRTNGLRAAKRLRDLARDFGETRFESACAHALKANVMTLRNMESILRNNADLRPSLTAPPKRPEHENVRGSQYFGEAA